MALFGPLISPYDPLEWNVRNKLQGPSIEHIFGTDELGRDILSRVIYGSGVALKIGVLAVALAAELV